MSRVLITGGAGFIGSHLCRRFLELGDAVVCMDNLLTGRLENVEDLFGRDGFSFVERDVTEFIHVSGPLDAVLHFASPASPADFERFPIQILKVKEGITYSEADFKLACSNWEKASKGELEFEAPNFDLFIRACEVSSKRLFPNFVFLDAPFNHNEKWDINDPDRYQYEIATMGCRTRVFENIVGEKTSIGRGNVSFTSPVPNCLQKRSVCYPVTMMVRLWSPVHHTGRRSPWGRHPRPG